MPVLLTNQSTECRDNLLTTSRMMLVTSCAVMTTTLFTASWRTCSSVSRTTSRVDDDVNFQARTLSGGQRTSCSMMLPPDGHSMYYVENRESRCIPLGICLTVSTQCFFHLFRMKRLKMYDYIQSTHATCCKFPVKG